MKGRWKGGGTGAKYDNRKRRVGLCSYIPSTFFFYMSNSRPYPLKIHLNLTFLNLKKIAARELGHRVTSHH
jgi:hypothetical protein